MVESLIRWDLLVGESPIVVSVEAEVCDSPISSCMRICASIAKKDERRFICDKRN